MEINNKIALVTGSTRGIGLAIGKKLCELGAVVYFNSNNSNLKGSNYENAFYLKGNVSSYEDMKSIFETIKKRHGGLDILVNNAGIYKGDDIKYENYVEVHKVNGYGYYLCSLLASEIMTGGKIINISSIYGVNPNKDSILASGVKAEVEAYTKAFARKLKGKIEVNSVAPGYTETSLLRGSLSHDFIEKEIKQTISGQMIKPKEIAKAVIFLIQNDGVTGQTIVVDAGYTM